MRDILESKCSRSNISLKNIICDKIKSRPELHFVLWGESCCYRSEVICDRQPELLTSLRSSDMAKQPMKVLNQWKNVVNIRYVKMKGKAGSHIIPGCEGPYHSNNVICGGPQRLRGNKATPTVTIGEVALVQHSEPALTTGSCHPTK